MIVEITEGGFIYTLSEKDVLIKDSNPDIRLGVPVSYEIFADITPQETKDKLANQLKALADRMINTPTSKSK